MKGLMETAIADANIVAEQMERADLDELAANLEGRPTTCAPTRRAAFRVHSGFRPNVVSRRNRTGGRNRGTRTPCTRLD